eukprot:1017584-Heterocapsa_arctica.AAC.1
MTVYVDDLMMAAPAADETALWRQLEEKVEFGDPPVAIGKFLGGHHVIRMRNGVTTFTCQMQEFLVDAAAKFKTEIGVQRLPPVRTPHLAEDF